MQPLVLDTNIVLDAFVFADVGAAPLVAAMEEGSMPWLATDAMREELVRVLAYPQIARRLAFHQRTADQVLARFDRHSTRVDEAVRAPVRCGDPDDQKFIDLAVEHRAMLVSKDFEVLRMKNRLARLGAVVTRLPPPLGEGGGGGSHGLRSDAAPAPAL